MCEAWDQVLMNCCISVIWKLNTGLGKSKWWLHPQYDSRKKNICTFPPLRRGLERSSSLKTLLYSLDSKSCTAETVSSHTLLIPQLLLSAARAANIIFPRNHNVHWLYFILFCGHQAPFVPYPCKRAGNFCSVGPQKLNNEVVRARTCLEHAELKSSSSCTYIALLHPPLSWMLLCTSEKMIILINSTDLFFVQHLNLRFLRSIMTS